MILRVSAAVRFVALGSLIWVASGCVNYFHQPSKARRARLGEDTPITSDLRNLPATKEKVVAAVYKFRDLTGQYRQTEVGTGFSTAITQGTTNILLKALEESGWFVPIERENVSNLLNERKIVRSSVAQFKEGENLPPLLFAGIILEGGVVSYDANIMTGGGGVRYFGAGSSTRYRQDRVTVYLRAVATKSGKILKTIYTSKTLLSQTIDASLFRYVTFKRLLEAETGITTTEPGQMVVVDLESWANPNTDPVGRVIEVLGWPGEPGVDMISVIHRFGLRTSFPDDVLAEARAVPEEPEPSEIARRKDWRDKLVITIDPADAKDHDDAIWVEKARHGWTLAVHIADVSHYIKPGSPMDKEAVKRGNSTYLVDRVLPMLPVIVGGSQ